jgi:hypothetical protein
LNKQICPYVEQTNLNTVKHVHIFGTKANQHPTNYFPNATELIMEHFTEKYDDTLVQILDRIVPLTQLTKLTKKHFDIAFTKFIHILYATPRARAKHSRWGGGV